MFNAWQCGYHVAFLGHDLVGGFLTRDVASAVLNTQPAGTKYQIVYSNARVVGPLPDDYLGRELSPKHAGL